MDQQITLYSFVDFDRSARVRWALNELQLPFKEVRLDHEKGENKTPEFLKRNPFGKIPTLEINGEAIFESGGICTYLAEQYGEAAALAPAIGSPLRAAYNQWCFFACSTLENAIFPIFRARRQNEGAAREAELVAEANKLFDNLSQTLKGKSFIVGDQFTMADILVGYGLATAARLNLLTDFPVLKSYVEKLENREAAKQSKLFNPTPSF